jgi:deoxyribodipyrimidine photo-lyase
MSQEAEIRIRHHSFIIDGMRENLREAEGKPCTYLPYIDNKPDTTLSLVEALLPHACWLVTDDFPSHFHQRQIDAVSRLARVPVEKIDSNGILPLKAAKQVYRRAFSFRRFIQSALPESFSSIPAANPLKRLLPATPFDLSSILEKHWVNGCDLNLVGRDTLRKLSIDYAVPPTSLRGGTTQASLVLSEFLESRLPDYSETRNHPDRRSTSGLALRKRLSRS